MRIRAYLLSCVLLFLGRETHAGLIAVPNGSFEVPDFADGSGLVFVTPGLAFGWEFTFADQAQFGIMDGSDVDFLGTSGDSPLPSPADGLQFGVIGTEAGSNASIRAPLPLATIEAGTQYDLSVAVGSVLRTNISDALGNLRITLLADDLVAATSVIPYSSIPRGEFALLTTSFATTGSGASFVGASLGVKLTFENPSPFGDNGFFDNVVLQSVDVAEPSFLSLIVLGAFVLMRRSEVS